MTESADNLKKIWTEEERLELATKLDAELDDFIEGLEKKRYEDGWPEDRWEEEMDKHPFFMKKAPQPGDEVHPMFEGLQKLKYDPEENTVEELALNYKEDGNFYMKHKKFRMAIYSYTEGIKSKCKNPEVLAILYNNRSAAHFYLKNYRSALNDAQKALKYKPDYRKSRWRAAQCAYELQEFQICAELCENLLEENTADTEAKALYKKNKEKKLDAERNERKENNAQKQREMRFHKLCEILKQREVKFDDMRKNAITEELLRPKFIPLEEHAVSYDAESDLLSWPIAFSYPEFLISDFHQQVPENLTMHELLLELFSETMPCDKNNIYRADTVHVYYENRKLSCLHKVDTKKSIKDIVKEEGFYVTGGALLFYIVPKDSPVEQSYLLEKRHPLAYS